MSIFEKKYGRLPQSNIIASLRRVARHAFVRLSRANPTPPNETPFAVFYPACSGAERYVSKTHKSNLALA
jgi:hypothetical protein